MPSPRPWAVPRRAHADGQSISDHAAFQRVAVDAPHLEVDTTDGYRPALPEIVSFVRTG